MPRSPSPEARGSRRSKYDDPYERDDRRSGRRSKDEAESSSYRSQHQSRPRSGYHEEVTDSHDRHRRSRQSGDESRSRHHSSRRERHDRDDRDSRSHRKRSYDSEDEERRRRKKDKRSTRRRDETSQERKERKAAKARAGDAVDQEQAAEERARAAEMLMYSTEDNPFNDANLGHRFRWGKKEEKEKKMGMTPAEAARRDAERRREATEEIARLNAARAQREADQKLREEEEAQMARLAESAAMSEWVAKEDDFHLEQSRRRAAIRIRENRAKPIDLLAMNLRWADADRIKTKRLDEDDEDDEAGLEIDLEEPYEIFETLSLEETEELHEDIQMYLNLDKNERNLDFWRSMIIVCDDKLADLREAAAPTSMRNRLDPTVKSEMSQMLSTKDYKQLAGLQDQVREKLRSGEPIDVEYWEALLKQIVVWRAKAKLRDLHEVVLENRLEYLRRKQRDEASRHQEELVAQLGEEHGAVPYASEAGVSTTIAENAGTVDDADGGEEWHEEMEPSPVDESRLTYDERHLAVQTWAELRSELNASRRRVLGATFVPRARTKAPEQDGVDASEALFAEEAAKGIDVEEEAFNGPANEAATAVSNQTYDWQDKYRPRKPRYFNRVHTGFEWNKYNQTHYDTDNPPPKVVQGYKFNIFYPDLIDKSKAPSYKIVKEPGNDETVVIKFEAGAPYEDIAFRIVNRPWQYSHKRGFRSSFDRGILQLYFNFQRNFYRK
ncbi:unnamed protein product [Parajaminaea phylloscopi]